MSEMELVREAVGAISLPLIWLAIRPMLIGACDAMQWWCGWFAAAIDVAGGDA